MPAWQLATGATNISVQHLRARQNIPEEIFFDAVRGGAYYDDEASTLLARDWTEQGNYFWMKKQIERAIDGLAKS